MPMLHQWSDLEHLYSRDKSEYEIFFIIAVQFLLAGL